MSVFKRILVFIGSYVFLKMASLLIACAMIADGIARNPVSHQEAHRLLLHAGVLFALKYHPTIDAVCLVLSALIAFGFQFLTLLVSVPVALAVFFFVQRLSTIQEARFKAMRVPDRLLAALSVASPAPTALPLPAAAPTQTPPKPSRIGTQVKLLSPVSVQVEYGAVTLPQGTLVTVVSETQDTLRVQSPDGWNASVPITQIEPRE